MANMRYGKIRDLAAGESTTIDLARTAKLSILLRRHAEVTGHKFEGQEVELAGQRIGVVVRTK